MLSGEFSAGSFFVAIGMIDQLSWPLISLAGIIRELIAIRPSCAAMEEFVLQSSESTDRKPLIRVEKKSAMTMFLSAIQVTARFCRISASRQKWAGNT